MGGYRVLDATQHVNGAALIRDPPMNSAWAPDQQRTMPLSRHVAQHPGSEVIARR
jgi:hypothetical protein